MSTIITTTTDIGTDVAVEVTYHERGAYQVLVHDCLVGYIRVGSRVAWVEDREHQQVAEVTFDSDEWELGAVTAVDALLESVGFASAPIRF